MAASTTGRSSGCTNPRAASGEGMSSGRTPTTRNHSADALPVPLTRSHSQFPTRATRCASASWRRRSRSSRSVRRRSVTSVANTMPPVMVPSAPRMGTTSTAQTLLGSRHPWTSKLCRSPARAARQGAA
jgi:hypothetical protein